MTARPRLWRIYRTEYPRGRRSARAVRLGAFRGNLREVKDEVRKLDRTMGEGSLFGHAMRSKHSALPIREPGP